MSSRVSSPAVVAAPDCNGFSSAPSVSYPRTWVEGAVAAGGVLFSRCKAEAEEAKSSKQAHLRLLPGCGWRHSIGKATVRVAEWSAAHWLGEVTPIEHHIIFHPTPGLPWWLRW